MYSHNNFEALPFPTLRALECVCGGQVAGPSAASAQSIPPFFVDFFHRLHRMLNEYSAELSRWSGGMRFCTSQRALYGEKFATTPPSAAKGRLKRTTVNVQKRGKNTPNDGRNDRRLSGHCRVRIFPLNKQSQADGRQQQKRAFSLSKPAENSQGTRAGQFSEFESVRNNVPPDAEQRKFSSRRRVAVHPPLSIRDRLRRTFAPENLAIAANEQMPLETLEQTLAETLPESITGSENYADFLRKYLEDFERELENDELVPRSMANQPKTDRCKNGPNSTQTNHGIGQNTDKGCCSAADSFDVDNFTAVIDLNDEHNDSKLSSRHNEGGAEEQLTTVTPDPTTVTPEPTTVTSGAVATVVVAEGRKRARPSSAASLSSTASSFGSLRFGCKVLKRSENGKRDSESAKEREEQQTGINGEVQMCVAERTERRAVIDTEDEQSESAETPAGANSDRAEEEEGSNWMELTISRSPTPCEPNKQCDDGCQTPQKSFPRTIFPSRASSSVAISSPYSIATVKVLEHGQVKFKTPPPSSPKTPTKSSSTSPTDEKLLMATPKLLSTRRVYCTPSHARRRPRRIAPQKEEPRMDGETQKTKGEKQLKQQKTKEEKKSGREERDGEKVAEEEKHRKDGIGEDGEEVELDREEMKGTTSSSQCKRSWKHSATGEGNNCDRNALTFYGTITASELDDDLIGDVLNMIHSTSPNSHLLRH